MIITICARPEFRGAAVGLSLCMWAPLGTSLAADNPAASYVELSGAMSGLQGSAAGDVTGSLYNNHERRMIHVTEIAVSSSGGRRIFRVNYLAPPQTVIEGVRISAGLRLDFRSGTKDWWAWTVTKAAWIDPKAWLLWRGVEATSAHAKREDCLSALEAKLSESTAENSRATADSSDLSNGIGRIRVSTSFG